MSKSPIALMTSIAYVNGDPHMGHALEAVQADIYARYYRLMGHPVHFLTGTDEHGGKIAKAAQDQGMNTQDFVDLYSSHVRSMYEQLQVSFDDFIRTTDKQRHWPSVIKLWQKLADQQLLAKRSYNALYCIGCEGFKTEKDLVDGKCPFHPTTAIQSVSEENYFFLLSQFNQMIENALTSTMQITPKHRAKEILSVIHDGLHDVSFSRPRTVLEWGIPVPGDDEQVMYVWCDALTNYISALGYAEESEMFQKWWQSPETRKIHFIGKDILRFHAAIWPGMLSAAGVALPTDIFVHGFVSINGQRMSKSTGNVEDPVAFMNEFGSDALRYYLAREIPAGDDGDFSRTRFIELYNGELANNLGNLIQRIVSMAVKNAITVADSTTVEGFTNISELETTITTHLEAFEIHRAIHELMQACKQLNVIIDENKPWALAKTDTAALAIFLTRMLTTFQHLVPYISIFLPETGKKIEEKLGLSAENQTHIEPRDTEALFMRK